eukprot:4914229-Pyramimonas_sp.AAC.1
MRIPVVRQHKHLGVLMTTDDDWWPEIQRRANEQARAINEMRHIICKERSTGLKEKLKYVRSNGNSRLLWQVETWPTLSRGVFSIAATGYMRGLRSGTNNIKA